MVTDVTNTASSKNSVATPAAADPGIGQLVGGILDDAQKLIEQQLSLLKHDVRQDIQRAKDSGMMLGAGAGLIAAGGLLLLFMLVYLTKWLIPTLEWWACYGLIGGAIALVGALIFWQGKKKLDSLNTPLQQTTEGLKENLQWQTNPN